MTQRVTEDDLLAFVEGELEAVRAREVAAAVQADPTLARMVREMSEQREMMSTIARATQLEAPSDLAQQAVEQAERDALLGVSEHSERSRGIRRAGPRRAPLRAAIAMAAVLILGISGWVLFLVNRTGPRAQQIAAAHDPTPKRPLDYPQAPKVMDPEYPFYLGSSDIVAGAISGIVVDPIKLFKPEKQTGANIARVDSEGARKFAESFSSNLAQSEDPLALTPSQAGAMALMGRLKLVVQVSDVAVAREHLVAYAQGRGGAFMAADGVGKGAASNTAATATTAPAQLHIALPEAKDADALVAELESLRQQVALAIGGKVVYRESSETPAAAATPPTDAAPSDLLWWTKPPEEWSAKPRTLIGVELQPASPSAPAPAEGEATAAPSTPDVH